MVMYKLFKRKSIAALAVTSLTISLGLVACGGGSSSGGGGGAGAVGGTSFSGPGSKWDFTLNDDGTFDIEHRQDVNSAIDMTVNGTYQRLISGFLRLTVSSATGTNAPTAGDEAWALEVPGYALMVKPIDPTSDQMIAMVTGGTCPSGDVDANWVSVNKEDGVDASSVGTDFFGTFHFDAASGVSSLPSMYALADPATSLAAQTLAAGTCSNGIMQVSGAVMYLTDNQGAIVHVDNGDADETNDQFIFALGQTAITNINNMDGAYAGMLFDANDAAGSQIQPVALVCTAGNCVGNIVTDIDTGAVSVDTVTVDLTGGVDQPSNGFITGTITDPGSATSNLVCMADADAAGSGEKIVSCVGQSPGDSTKMFNVLFVSR